MHAAVRESVPPPSRVRISHRVDLVVVVALAGLLIGTWSPGTGTPLLPGAHAASLPHPAFQSLLGVPTTHTPESVRAQVLGLDTEGYAGPFNWAQTFGGGYQFAYFLGAFGTACNDSLTTPYLELAAANGFAVGAYDYAELPGGQMTGCDTGPGAGNATDEADEFIAWTYPYYTSGMLDPVLDLEQGCAAVGQGYLNPTQLSSWVGQWMAEMERYLSAIGYPGVVPMLYVDSSYAQNCLAPWTAQYPLWIADWVGLGSSPALGIWSSYDFWQYSGNGIIPGRNVSTDLDAFNGGMAAMKSGWTFGPGQLGIQYSDMDLDTGQDVNCGGTLWAGDTIQWSASASGGTSPYAYWWTFGDGTRGLGTTVNHVFQTAGTVTVTAYGSDSSSQVLTGTGACSFQVAYPPPLAISSFTVAPNSLDVGSPMVLTTIASGGVGTLSYAYAGLPTGCSSANTATLSCTPTTAGSWTVQVTVTDPQGGTTTASAAVSVFPLPTLSSFVVSPAAVDVGSPITLTATVATGSGLTYLYTGLPPGCTSTNTPSWSCTPSSSGIFVPRVYVNDTRGRSASATATLTVTSLRPLAVSLTASPAGFALGGSTTFTASASGGTGTYTTYAWAWLPTGCTSSDSATLACTPTAVGHFNSTVTVTDSGGHTITSASAQVNVEPDGGTLSVSLTASSSSLQLGAAVTYSASATGGPSPYSYVWNVLPSGCNTSDDAVLSCAPTIAGHFNTTVTLSDSTGQTTTSMPVQVDVYSVSGALMVGVSATPPSFALGGTTLLTATVSGGVSPYGYVWTNLPPGCASANVRVLSCTPTSPERTNVTVIVSDSDSHAGLRSVALDVWGPISLLTGSLTASPSSLTLGGTTHLNATATGGQAPYAYAWTGLPTGCSAPSTAEADLVCTPTGTGHFNTTVTITDATGKTTQSTVDVDVNAMAGAGPSTGMGDVDTAQYVETALLICTSVVMALAAVLALFRLKKRQTRTPPTVRTAPPMPPHPPTGQLSGWGQVPPADGPSADPVGRDSSWVWPAE